MVIDYTGVLKPVFPIYASIRPLSNSLVNWSLVLQKYFLYWYIHWGMDVLCTVYNVEAIKVLIYYLLKCK